MDSDCDGDDPLPSSCSVTTAPKKVQTRKYLSYDEIMQLQDDDPGENTFFSPIAPKIETTVKNTKPKMIAQSFSTCTLEEKFQSSSTETSNFVCSNSYISSQENIKHDKSAEPPAESNAIDWSALCRSNSNDVVSHQVKILPAGAAVGNKMLPKYLRTDGCRRSPNNNNIKVRGGKHSEEGVRLQQEKFHETRTNPSVNNQRKPAEDLHEWYAITTNPKSVSIKEEKKVDKVEVKPEVQPEVKPFENEFEKCDCENCDQFIGCSTWIQQRSSFKSYSIVGARNGPRFLNLENNQTQESKREIVMEKKLTKSLALFGTLIPKPMTTVMKDSYFKEGIQSALKDLNCLQPNHVQSYIWLTIFRRLNVFIIGLSNSGKTFSYLPVICAIASDYSDTYDAFKEIDGPIIIIFCAKLSKCENVCKQTVAILKNNIDQLKVKINNKSDILITTPKDFYTMLKSDSFDLRRLYHVILEDADILFKSSHEMGKILKLFHFIQANRPQNKSLQLIATSENWTRDLDILMNEIHLTPLICFNNYFEAALFGRTNFNQKTFKAAIKRCYLNDILQKHYVIKKSIVFCRDDEIVELSEYLRMTGIENIKISSNLESDTLIENEDIWNSFTIGNYKVLLISDIVFSKLDNIINAEWLIHYHIPTDLETFYLRFKSISGNIHSRLSIDELNTVKPTFVDIIYDAEIKNDLIFDLITRSLSRNIVSHLKF